MKIIHKLDHATVWKGPSMSEIKKKFHTPHMKLGIKHFEWHLVLVYHEYLDKYIHDEMELLDISSLDTAYQYTIKIEHNFK